LELFPASGQLGENTTTRWYNAPRYKNVVFEDRKREIDTDRKEAQFSVAQGKLNWKKSGIWSNSCIFERKKNKKREITFFKDSMVTFL
jgi:hypothetical protein